MRLQQINLIKWYKGIRLKFKLVLIQWMRVKLLREAWDYKITMCFDTNLIKMEYSVLPYIGYSVVVDSVQKSRASGKKLLYKYLGKFLLMGK